MGAEREAVKSERAGECFLTDREYSDKGIKAPYRAKKNEQQSHFLAVLIPLVLNDYFQKPIKTHCLPVKWDKQEYRLICM